MCRAIAIAIGNMSPGYLIEIIERAKHKRAFISNETLRSSRLNFENYFAQMKHKRYFAIAMKNGIRFKKLRFWIFKWNSNANDFFFG